MIAKVRLSHLLPSQPEPFSSILSSSYLSDWYEEAAKQLDIASPRLPSSILSIPQDDRNVCSVIHNYYKVALLSQLKALSFSTPFSLPLYSDMQLAAINWNQCRVMNSKKLPLFLSFAIHQHSQMNVILGGNL